MKHWYQTSCLQPCKESIQLAKKRQNNLTKPAGSLGELENIAIHFAGWQRTEKPNIDNIMVRVFAADHGICQQNVSAFPQEVTMQMVLNFIQGGAAISVLCKQEKANFAVVNMGLATPLPTNKKTISNPALIHKSIAKGTQDFSLTSAMTEKQAIDALAVGRDIIHAECTESSSKLGSWPQLFIGGEMGIGNTSSASAIYCALLGISPQQACGPGTGIDTEGISRKSDIIQQALTLHQLDNIESSIIENDSPVTQKHAFNVLCSVGGFEIAGLVGAYIAAAQQQIPSLVDGFISTAAALLAVKLNPSCRNWLLFSHQSAEPAHIFALQYLNADPLLNIDMRLGEGSGAAVCIPLLKTALNLHQNMATFAEASVAENH